VPGRNEHREDQPLYVLTPAGAPAINQQARIRSPSALPGSVPKSDGSTLRAPRPVRPERREQRIPQPGRQIRAPPADVARARHTWATLALERGIHPRVVQERLGHSTIAITLGIYSHVAPTLHDEAATLVASLGLD
jgi:hypothetical protein